MGRSRTLGLKRKGCAAASSASDSPVRGVSPTRNAPVPRRIEILRRDGRRGLRVLEQDQLDARRVPAEQREVAAVEAVVHAQR